MSEPPTTKELREEGYSEKEIATRALASIGHREAADRIGLAEIVIEFIDEKSGNVYSDDEFSVEIDEVVAVERGSGEENVYDGRIHLKSGQTINVPDSVAGEIQWMKEEP